MAYMSQERKAQIAPVVKAILKQYGVKGSLAVSGHSTLVLNIKSGKLDFIGDYNDHTMNDPYRQARNPYFQPVTGHIQVNTYHYRDHFGSKVIKKFFDEVLRAMNVGNHDNSDIMTDYFDVGWYVNINIGKWNRSYVLEK